MKVSKSLTSILLLSLISVISSQKSSKCSPENNQGADETFQLSNQLEDPDQDVFVSKVESGDAAAGCTETSVGAELPHDTAKSVTFKVGDILIAREGPTPNDKLVAMFEVKADGGNGQFPIFQGFGLTADAPTIRPQNPDENQQNDAQNNDQPGEVVQENEDNEEENEDNEEESEAPVIVPTGNPNKGEGNVEVIIPSTPAPTENNNIGKGKPEVNISNTPTVNGNQQVYGKKMYKCRRKGTLKKRFF
ncbi:hypothetical protein HK099_001368 [Clydaea vesicula]|uniref:Uncharacterized protein n=1 Tax=Clydaea vesicula TaxID=447962 RepID=A0AAD5U3T1_9FUNG|nr:hypothetical protein HK099_001368 [Clydaea vesicula]